MTAGLANCSSDPSASRSSAKTSRIPGADASVASSGTESNATMTDPTGPGIDVKHLRVRPLSLPRLGAGERCPVTTTVTSPSTDLGQMLGSGPARPVGLGEDAQLGIAPPANFGSATWGGNKVLWALHADAGPALVRGQQLDGNGEVRFDEGSTPSIEKVLDPTGRAPLAGGWFDFPGYTRVERPGCYGYQIDTGAGSSTVIFQAV